MASVCFICLQGWEFRSEGVRVYGTPVDRVAFNPSVSPVHQSVGSKFILVTNFRPIASTCILLSATERSMRVERMSEIQASP